MRCSRVTCELSPRYISDLRHELTYTLALLLLYHAETLCLVSSSKVLGTETYANTCDRLSRLEEEVSLKFLSFQQQLQVDTSLNALERPPVTARQEGQTIFARYHPYSFFPGQRHGRRVRPNASSFSGTVKAPGTPTHRLRILSPEACHGRRITRHASSLYEVASAWEVCMKWPGRRARARTIPSQSRLSTLRQRLQHLAATFVAICCWAQSWEASLAGF